MGRDHTTSKTISACSVTTGKIQVTSDGYRTYTHNVLFELGSRVDFAQLIKTYANSQTETRYSPATITGIAKVERFGNPDNALPTLDAIDQRLLQARDATADDACDGGWRC